ncbi:MAG: hypothetical protein BWX90_00617 [bacterium ADurb.Bin132]|nr:MAG: hypothetical protein BWX90_00617 [bacterium ADurb.Bin132]
MPAPGNISIITSVSGPILSGIFMVIEGPSCQLEEYVFPLTFEELTAMLPSSISFGTKNTLGSMRVTVDDASSEP